MIARLHRRAADEIREAAEWYAARGERLDERFIQAIREAMTRIENDPTQSAKLETLPSKERIRRFLLPDFPYLIIYEEFDEEIFVYAVAHASRRPHYWRRRKRN